MTKVALAKKDTKSLKTTIPEAIVEYLQLEGKDTLEWQMGTRDDEPVALVKRRENAELPQNFDNNITLIKRRNVRTREADKRE